MPYKSEAQRKKFHEMKERGEISADVVSEWDKASHGMKLPERVGPKKEEAPKPKGPWSDLAEHLNKGAR